MFNPTPERAAELAYVKAQLKQAHHADAQWLDDNRFLTIFDAVNFLRKAGVLIGIGQFDTYIDAERYLTELKTNAAK
jgi:hypothetical protein